ncbi:MAG TPA: sugar phosphate isomerase/epimerase, partial [Pirellulaceae bacterium]|nr:sugar phosphate isomerase/epimerase [Pirellulaceae bacterium]
MFVAASTECFGDLSLPLALERLADLEYTSVELALYEDANQLRPSQVAANVEEAVATCRNTQRLDVVAFDTRITAEKAAHYEQFTAICRLAKAAKVVTLSVPSAELGTPFNEEVE